MKAIFVACCAMALLAAKAVHAQGPWLDLYRSDIALVQIDTAEIMRGPNGAMLVNLIRIHPELQKSFSGTVHKYALSRVEYDCTGRRHWLHVYWLGLNSQVVEHKQFENPEPLNFLPAGTLAGETALAVCAFLRARGRGP